MDDSYHMVDFEIGSLYNRNYIFNTFLRDYTEQSSHDFNMLFFKKSLKSAFPRQNKMPPA